jgi:hypothetical protein
LFYIIQTLAFRGDAVTVSGYITEKTVEGLLDAFCISQTAGNNLKGYPDERNPKKGPEDSTRSSERKVIVGIDGINGITRSVGSVWDLGCTASSGGGRDMFIHMPYRGL